MLHLSKLDLSKFICPRLLVRTVSVDVKQYSIIICVGKYSIIICVGKPRMATSTFTQFLSTELHFVVQSIFILQVLASNSSLGHRRNYWFIVYDFFHTCPPCLCHYEYRLLWVGGRGNGRTVMFSLLSNINY